jgi:uracil-DNA glycosylase
VGERRPSPPPPPPPPPPLPPPPPPAATCACVCPAKDDTPKHHLYNLSDMSSLPSDSLPTNESDSLQKIAAEVRACTLCGLAPGRTNAVPGEGPHNAELMLIGEAPGQNEDKQGRPFVGASGQFLTELIAKAGFKREDVFIANVVKCRPPQNRDPQPDEIKACGSYLERQIAVINPKVIVTLGRFSMARYFPNAKISAIHGQAQVINGRTVVPMFHPAAALHDGSKRAPLEEDFARLKEIIRDAEQRAAPKTAAPPKPEDDDPEAGKQLSLF